MWPTVYVLYTDIRVFVVVVLDTVITNILHIKIDG